VKGQMSWPIVRGAGHVKLKIIDVDMAVILSVRDDVRRTLIDVDKLQRLQADPPPPQSTVHLTFTFAPPGN